ncbi:DNA polymerase III subunit beta [Candidatus Parcubacteria bacterium]|nr:DNA polymerase III subunit beta [Candidatus Parcubacteria bacterium]
MKIESIRETLVDAVSRAEKVSGRNTTLPVLAGILLSTDKNQLILKATNLDLGITIKVPVKVSLEGKVVVPAQTLNQFLNSISKEKSISLESVNQTLKIVTSGSRATFKTLPTEDFPIIPELSDDLAFTMPTRDFIGGLKAVSFAAAQGSMKPELSSVLVSYQGDELVFAATDSFRLAEKRIKVKKIPHFNQLLIPAKNASDVVRLFDGISDDLSVTLGDNQIALRSGNVCLTSRVIDGTFPDYKQIIKQIFLEENISRVVVLKQDLTNALKTAVVFSDNFNQLILKVVPKEKVFQIESKNKDVGENEQSVPAVIEGKEVTMSVNSRYFTDSFQSIGVDSMSLSFSGEGRPILIQGVGDKSFLYIVMPMNR